MPRNFAGVKQTQTRLCAVYCFAHLVCKIRYCCHSSMLLSITYLCWIENTKTDNAIHIHTFYVFCFLIFISRVDLGNVRIGFMKLFKQTI